LKWKKLLVSLIFLYISAVNQLGETVLHRAVLNGNSAMLAILLENEADVTAICNCGSAMHIAAAMGKETILLMPLAKGADIYALHRHQMPPLLHAVLKGNFEATKLQIDGGASSEIVDAEGTTLLHRLR
jgi:ankyrin repeat protein